MNFFWRIFLSVWAVMPISVVMTVAVANWLPSYDAPTNSASLSGQMATLMARELRGYLADDPATAGQILAENYGLDFAPFLEVYVLDPDGNEVLGRELPEAVAEVDRSLAEGLPAARARVHTRTDELKGYRVIGYESDSLYNMMGKVLTKPGGRGLHLLLLVVVSAAVAAVLARFIVLPVRRLREAGQKVADGDLTVRVAPSVGGRTDDIARLAHDFDIMTGRVDAVLQSQQRLLRDVSHELRSPLARLQAMLSISHRKADADSVDRIDRMEEELLRLDDLIGEVLAYSRMESQPGLALRPTDIVDLVQNIVDDASLEAQMSGKEVYLQGPEHCLMNLDSRLVQSAVENVVRNAVKYTADGTIVGVMIIEEVACVRIIVDDCGPGVPPDSLDKIFEPFYRVEESRSTTSGTGGIGLAIAERSVRLHGGTMMASNLEGGGLRVEMVLPTEPDDSSE